MIHGLRNLPLQKKAKEAWRTLLRRRLGDLIEAFKWVQRMTEGDSDGALVLNSNWINSLFKKETDKNWLPKRQLRSGTG